MNLFLFFPSDYMTKRDTFFQNKKAKSKTDDTDRYIEASLVSVWRKFLTISGVIVVPYKSALIKAVTPEMDKINMKS